MTKPATAASALKVQAALGRAYQAPELDASTRTAADALFAFEEISAAADTPNAVFRLTPADLLRLTGGILASIARQLRPTTAAARRKGLLRFA